MLDINITMINLHNITTTTINNVKPNNYHIFFYMFLLPIIVALILFILLKFMPEIKIFVTKKLGNFGYIEIWYITTNRRIRIRMVALDEFNNFTIGKKKYSLEQMYHFIIGYKNNIPVFMYDSNFILPLIIEKKKVNDEIKRKYAEIGIELTDKDISGIAIKLDPNILELVYKKKLISDLYSVVKDDKMQKMLLYVIIGAVIIAVLYYTGMLDSLLSTFGVHIHPVVNQTTSNTTTSIVTNATNNKNVIIPR